MPSRVAVVSPRFGPAVVGGAEAVLREVATGLAGRGWPVDVLTTCADNHYTWANDHPEGTTVVDGLTVHRFEAVPQSSSLGVSAQIKIQHDVLPGFDEQLSWLSWRFTVPGLFEHLLVEGDAYDAVLFAPYLFWTTTVCLPLVADRAISLPCLHDESYARLDVVAPALSQAARVWFLSEPEHQLAHRLRPLPTHAVTGAGVDVGTKHDPDRFRRRFRVRRPFLLYAGRREEGKGWDWLLSTYADAVATQGLELDLVSIGVGDVTIPRELAGRVIDLGMVSDQTRDDALAAATAYVQPSKMESFSRTVMEAWLAGTPVLAVTGGEVVAWHCERSGGGLLFDDPTSLAAGVRQIVDDPAGATAMAEGGRRYVLENYTWPVVLDRMEEELGNMGLSRPDVGTQRARQAGEGAPAPSPATSAGRSPAGNAEPAGVPSPAGVITRPSDGRKQVSGRTRTLVVASYPPIRTAGAGAALDAVRSAVRAGGEAVVASPRPSAAELAVSVDGPLAGRHLRQLRLATGATRLVLCAERDLPVPTTGLPAPLLPALQRLTVAQLAAELRAWGDVTLVRCGELGIPDAVWATLAGAATTVVERPDEVGEPGATVFGPEGNALAPLLRRGASVLTQRALGRHAPRAQALAARATRRLRAAFVEGSARRRRS